jgi:hypothetical protein
VTIPHVSQLKPALFAGLRNVVEGVAEVAASRQDKEVSPTQERDQNKARREAPGDARHRRQRIFGQASELPSQNRHEDQKDRNEEPETGVKVPIGAVKSLNVEMGGSQRSDNRIYSPMWIDSTEAPRVCPTAMRISRADAMR